MTVFSLWKYRICARFWIFCFSKKKKAQNMHNIRKNNKRHAPPRSTNLNKCWCNLWKSQIKITLQKAQLRNRMSSLPVTQKILHRLFKTISKHWQPRMWKKGKHIQYSALQKHRNKNTNKRCRAGNDLDRKVSLCHTQNDKRSGQKK